MYFFAGDILSFPLLSYWTSTRNSTRARHGIVSQHFPWGSSFREDLRATPEQCGLTESANDLAVIGQSVELFNWSHLCKHQICHHPHDREPAAQPHRTFACGRRDAPASASSSTNTGISVQPYGSMHRNHEDPACKGSCTELWYGLRRVPSAKDSSRSGLDTLAHAACTRFLTGATIPGQQTIRTCAS
ncbi:uncharacterized protein C8Q71DRAFT_124739 [Rhodofomes roseus]|uniref:Uncharacterized protein n=1 Tax=Rhodofomes roseus TaxID=34475 RepID=A0ABQ8KB54_9APHY|nr:uncharacterized protein C8Q71DRAFT_124739 [Rhodofomes roseus]KAH9834788.1 hypothetical protein C8Q71DRAFT_124739 [Rhodofomes roseus]